MTIPESQLERWATLGATTASAATYASVQTALDRYAWPDGVRYAVYLQGSYRNATNVRGDSDVDVVAELTSVVRLDLAGLTDLDRARARARYGDSDYGFPEFRADVGRALYRHYGWLAVSDAPKCFKVEAASGRLGADVVPCISLARHVSVETVVKGMTFLPTDSSRWIQNFPKLHFDAGATKNGDAATAGWFKPLVRVVKNMRNRINDDRIFKLRAPSYFLECLLWNVPNELFGESLQRSLHMSLVFLQRLLADNYDFMCPHQQHALFGTRPEQWNRDEARAFIDAALKLWNGWYEDASFLPRL